MRYFLTLADELHFGRAAKRLYISQQGLSYQIASLEKDLRVQLFIRDAKGLRLTDAKNLRAVRLSRARYSAHSGAVSGTVRGHTGGSLF